MKKTCYKGSDLDKGFKKLANSWLKTLMGEFTKLGGEITTFNIGFYYFNGFARVNGKCYYFSVTDFVRFTPERMLIRSARDEKDFSGGRNQFVNMDEAFANQIKKIIVE